MDFHISNVTWGKDLITSFPLVFTESDKHNAFYMDRYQLPLEARVNLRDGFECGEGWYTLIHSLAEAASVLVTDLRKLGHTDAYIHSCIVKEKFGQLRWQGQHNLPSRYSDIWNGFRSDVEAHSLGICEFTGHIGELRRTKNGERAWHKTLCTAKARELGYDLSDYERGRS